MRVILNQAAGALQPPRQQGVVARIRQALAEHCPGASLRLCRPDEIKAAIRSAPASAVVVGGGDGTIRLAAELLAHQGKRLGVLPLGTFNWLARELNIPLQPEAAVRALAHGSSRAIDLGEVNGHYFVHNASMGIHRRAVEERDRYRQRIKLGKAAAVSLTLLKAILRPPMFEGYLETEKNRQFICAPFVFVGNNLFDTAPFAFLRRRSLWEGKLSIYYAHQVGPPELLKMAFFTLIRRHLREVPELERVSTRKLTIASRRSKIKVLLDGELIRMRSPLRFRLHPGALKLIIPNS